MRLILMVVALLMGNICAGAAAELADCEEGALVTFKGTIRAIIPPSPEVPGGSIHITPTGDDCASYGSSFFKTKPPSGCVVGGSVEGKGYVTAIDDPGVDDPIEFSCK